MSNANDQESKAVVKRVRNTSIIKERAWANKHNVRACTASILAGNGTVQPTSISMGLKERTLTKLQMNGDVLQPLPKPTDSLCVCVFYLLMSLLLYSSWHSIDFVGPNDT